MKKYPHIINELYYRPLVITRAKHMAICRVLESRLAAEGVLRTEEEDGEKAETLNELEAYGYRTYGATAIIPVHGILGKHLDWLAMSSGGCDCDTVAAMIDVAQFDQNVEKLLFDFRSPGGSVTGLPELGRKIAGVKGKETQGFTDSECCSGALWLAMQCESFYCTQSSQVGSIGVWTAYIDLSKAMKKAGEKVQAISAGKYKLMGAYWKPLTDEELGLLQADVDKIYRQFCEAVNLRREVKEEFMQGQIFDGEEAVEAGIADGLVEEMEELLE